MVIYEVNIAVEPALVDEYGRWLREHIAEILEIDGFVGARWLEESREESDGTRYWSVHYSLRDRAALESYFANYAAEMRRRGLERFPSGLTITRRVLEERGLG